MMKIRREPMMVPEMGLLKKMKGLPAEINRAWRNDLSKIGPNTKAKRRGPGSRLTFLKR
jgi:hypothetical protein